MAKAKNKTIANDASVTAFLDAIKDDQKREDSYKLLEIMTRLSGYPPKMWGSSIIGFGEYHYKYESGREGDMCRIGFSPRAQNLTLYIITGFSDYEEELSRLGKYKLGKSCLYIKRLSDVDEQVLEQLVIKDLNVMNEKYPV
jgi:hypothetical protein